MHSSRFKITLNSEILPVFYFLLLSFLISGNSAQDCSYRQSVDLGEAFEIKSPNYPNEFTGLQSCTWDMVTSFSDLKLKFQCSVFNLPRQGRDCSNNYVKVFLDPDRPSSQMTEKTYCQSQSPSVTSRNNRMKVSFKSTSGTRGRFRCTVSGVRS